MVSTVQVSLNTGFGFGFSTGFGFSKIVISTRRFLAFFSSDVSSFLIPASDVGGVYNLTDGYHPSFNELSYSIANQMGKMYIPNIPYLVAKSIGLIGDCFGKNFPINSLKVLKITSTLTFDDSKARLKFGWSPNSVLKYFKN